MLVETIHKIIEPLPYLKIENMYTPEELEYIFEELSFLSYVDKMNPPDLTGSALVEWKPQKNNSGIFLDSAYAKRELSNILQVNRKIFEEKYLNLYSELSFAYQSIKTCNIDTTLISYYDNGGYYKSHHDNSCHTILTWFFKEPKAFKGGDFYFSNYDEKVEIKNNMTIIFPSFVKHHVDEVFMEPNMPRGSGRYCMSQFVNVG